MGVESSYNSYERFKLVGFTLPAFLGSKTLVDEYVVLTVLIALISIALLKWAFSPGGVAWKNGRNSNGAVAIPGPRGLPIFGASLLSRGLAHRSLASMALHYNSKQLMAFSLGSTPIICHGFPTFMTHPALLHVAKPWCPVCEKLVKAIIEQHQLKNQHENTISDNADFVDVLLSLDGDEKLNEDDMIAVLWEMIFRGTDTVALLTEWVMAELVLHPEVQAKLRQELKAVVGDRGVVDADMPRLSYLQAVVKEVLRLHPRPAATLLGSIVHGRRLLEQRDGYPRKHNSHGRRVCPGKNLGLATVGLWVAKLVDHFDWAEDKAKPVDFSEVLKLSCEMKHPLSAVAV
ncbi:UNVERIFIED_CONTAM: cytochrome [Sesamum calycinum]|uniref:Cytochrome n=1 Tax=Sesamum calycinum TaxID=2727403 RepID=A0AAW2SVK5_9LAMI